MNFLCLVFLLMFLKRKHFANDITVPVLKVEFKIFAAVDRVKHYYIKLVFQFVVRMSMNEI